MLTSNQSTIGGKKSTNTNAKGGGKAPVKPPKPTKSPLTTDKNDKVKLSDKHDELSGKNGNDSLLGGDGNDTLTGDAGNDTLNGQAGNDSLSGGANNDKLFGEDGQDTLKGDAGNDTLDGGDGNDTLNGGDGNDSIDGGADNDTIDGGAGHDTLNGGDGNDSINGGDGVNSISGGAGNDTITSGSGVDTISGNDGNDSISSGTGNDSLNGDAGDDTLAGGDGDDAINGGADGDNVQGQAGNDTLNGGDGDDNLDGGDGNDLASGDEGNDILLGGIGNDTLNGGDGADYLYGQDGDDSLTGGAGNDSIEGNNGNDTLDGGDGDDTYYFTREIGTDTVTDVITDTNGANTLSFAGIDISDDVTVNLTTGTGALHNLELSFSGATIAAVVGGYGDDEFTGKDGLNVQLSGGAGNDTLIGLSGNDTLVGGDDSDSLDGGSGDDSINGGDGSDTIVVGLGVDVLNGGDDSDTFMFGDSWTAGASLDGGDGIDLLNFQNVSEHSITLDLSTGELTNGTVTLTGISNFEYVFGTSGNDSITGDAGNNSLMGGDGNDVIHGGDGIDIMFGGKVDYEHYTYTHTGSTTLYGDAGNDLFGVLGTEGYTVIHDSAGTEDSVYIQPFLQGQLFYGGYSLNANVDMENGSIAVGVDYQELQINSGDYDDQMGSVVTTLGNGYFLVVWQSSGQDGSDAGIFARLYDPMGHRVESEFQVNTTTTGDQSSPAVAALGNDGFVVTWISNDDSDSGIYAQQFRISEGLQSVGEEFRVNTYATDAQYHSSVAGLADGGFVVTWTVSNGSGDIMGRVYDDDGEPVGSEFMVNSWETSNQSHAQVTALSDGGFVVTWSSDFQDGSDTGIYAQRFDSDGQTVGSEFQVNSLTTGTQSASSVAGLTGGGYVVTWQSQGPDGDDFGIRGQLYGTDGIAVGSEFAVNTFTTGAQTAPTVTGLADGGFVVTWTSANQDGSGTGVYGQVFEADGDHVGTEFHVNTTTTGDQQSTSVSALASGGFVVIWENDGNISAQIFDSEGDTSPHHNVGEFTPGEIEHFSLGYGNDTVTFGTVGGVHVYGSAGNDLFLFDDDITGDVYIDGDGDGDSDYLANEPGDTLAITTGANLIFNLDETHEGQVSLGGHTIYYQDIEVFRTAGGDDTFNVSTIDEELLDMTIQSGAGNDTLNLGEDDFMLSWDPGSGSNVLHSSDTLHYFDVEDTNSDGLIDTLQVRFDDGGRLYLLNFFNNTEDWHFYADNQLGVDSSAILGTLGDSTVSSFQIGGSTYTFAELIEDWELVYLV